MSEKESKETEFIRLVNESQRIIHNICRMYCDDETHREDLFQEIILQLWKSYPSFKKESKFSSWLYKVALNVAIQDFRKEKKRKTLLSDKSKIQEINHNPQHEYVNEKVEALYKAISRLSKVEKAIVMLYLDEIPYEEIAQIIGITQNYVRVRMNRIKTKLKENLNH